MINNIYFDLDECILHTAIGMHPGQTCFIQEFKEWSDREKKIVDNTYYTMFRPCAKDLFAFAESLVGRDCVYILTESVREYASGINDHMNFVNPSNLLTREDLDAHEICGPYGSKVMLKHATANHNNVLIDNMRAIYNSRKFGFTGIERMENYLEVRDYWGANLPSDTFERDVKKFLLGHIE